MDTPSSETNENSRPQKCCQKEQYNRKCTAVKRLLREAVELANPTPEYSAHPLEDNLFEWHFTIRGPLDSEFETGIYHGRILFPADYPMTPPAFSFFTPNGRYTTGEKICLSISNYHPETWLPSWSIRTALVAIISFMTTSGGAGNIGELDYPVKDRKVLAKRSLIWECLNCGKNQLPNREGANTKNVVDSNTTTDELMPPTAEPIDENQNIIGTDTDLKRESDLNISTLDNITNELNLGETLGEEFAGLAFAIQDGIGPEIPMGIEEFGHQHEYGGELLPVTQIEEVDLATVVQQATGSRYTDFGIGAVVTGIVALFIRRLIILSNDFDLGLF